MRLLPKTYNTSIRAIRLSLEYEGYMELASNCQATQAKEALITRANALLVKLRELGYFPVVISY